MAIVIGRALGPVAHMEVLFMDTRWFAHVQVHYDYVHVYTHVHVHNCVHVLSNCYFESREKNRNPIIRGTHTLLDMYVMRKPQIRTILGLFMQTSDSTFAHTILGLPIQS